MATMFKQEEDLKNLFPDPLSIDVDASHGAWLRNLDTDREFIDFSGTWSGWGLGHGLRGYAWQDFLNDVESVSDQALHFQIGTGATYVAEIVEPAGGFHFLCPSSAPKSSFSNASSAWPVVGSKDMRGPIWFNRDWFEEQLSEAQAGGYSIYLDETKTFWTDLQPLLLGASPWSRASGSLIFLDDFRVLKLSKSDSETRAGEGLNLAKFFDGKLALRGPSEFDALRVYFQRVFGEIISGLEGLEVVGKRGLNLWYKASSEGLRDAIVRAAYNEGLLIGFGGAQELSFHVPYQVKADVIGRAAAQFEAGLKRALEEMNRWLK